VYSFNLSGEIIMTKVIADTTCGLPLEELAALGVDVIPQIIIFNDKPFKDDSEIDTPTFLAKLKEAKTKARMRSRGVNKRIKAEH